MEKWKDHEFEANLGLDSEFEPHEIKSPQKKKSSGWARVGGLYASPGGLSAPTWQKPCQP